MTALLFFVILGALVFVHELGHFLSAKKAGIRVDEFALGFPPRIWSKKIGETTYTLNLVPFGGYVKIFGEDGIEEEGSGADSSRRFTSKPRWIQALVLSSGVLGNVLFSWILLALTFCIGVPSSPDGRYGSEVKDAVLTITTVLPNSPASRVGLKEGDTVVALAEGNRQFSDAKARDADEAGLFIDNTREKLSFTIEREGKEYSYSLSPESGVVEGRKVIGVGLNQVGVVRFNPARALVEGARMTGDLLRVVTVGLVGFIGQAVTGGADLSAITGPIGIAGLVGEARVLGFVYLLSFVAFISINLAVINLIPFPALDGGRLLFLALEAIRRRPIPWRITRTLNMVGFTLLILLMLIITYRDILKLL